MTASQQNRSEDQAAQILLGQARGLLNNEDQQQFFDRLFAGAAGDAIDRSTAEGKASAVQFIHYPFKPAEIAAFKQAGARVVTGFDHPAYAHMTVMPDEVRAALARDFD